MINTYIREKYTPDDLSDFIMLLRGFFPLLFPNSIKKFSVAVSTVEQRRRWLPKTIFPLRTRPLAARLSVTTPNPFYSGIPVIFIDISRYWNWRSFTNFPFCIPILSISERFKIPSYPKSRIVIVLVATIQPLHTTNTGISNTVSARAQTNNIVIINTVNTLEIERNPNR